MSSIDLYIFHVLSTLRDISPVAIFFFFSSSLVMAYGSMLSVSSLLKRKWPHIASAAMTVIWVMIYILIPNNDLLAKLLWEGF